MHKYYFLVLFFLMAIPGHSIVFINTTDGKTDSDSLIEARNKRQFFTPDSLKPEVYLEACKDCDSSGIPEGNIPPSDSSLSSNPKLNSDSVIIQKNQNNALDTLLCEEFLAEKKHEAKLEKLFKSKPFSGVEFEIHSLDQASLEYAFEFFELAQDYGLKFNLSDSNGLPLVYALWEKVSKAERRGLLKGLKSFLFDSARTEIHVSSELKSGKVWESKQGTDKQRLNLTPTQKLEILIWIKKVRNSRGMLKVDSTWAQWSYGKRDPSVDTAKEKKVLISSRSTGRKESRKDILAKFSRFELKNESIKPNNETKLKKSLDWFKMSSSDWKAIFENSMQREWLNFEINCSQNTNQCFDLFITQQDLKLVGEIENGFQLQQKNSRGFVHTLEVVGDNELMYTPLLTLGYVGMKPFRWQVYNEWIYSEWVKGTEIDVSIENSSTGFLSHFFASQQAWDFKSYDSPFEKWFSEKWGGGVSQKKGNRNIEAEFKFATGTIQKTNPDFSIFELEGFDMISSTDWNFPLLEKNQFKKLDFKTSLSVGLTSFQYQQYQEEGAPLGLYLGFDEGFLFDINLNQPTNKIQMKWNVSGGSYFRYKSLKNGEFEPVESYSGFMMDQDVNAIFYKLMDDSYLGRRSLAKENFTKYFLKSEVELGFVVNKFEAKLNINLWRGGLGNTFDEVGPMQIRHTLEASYSLYNGLNGVVGWGYNPNLVSDEASTIYLRMNRYLPF